LIKKVKRVSDFLEKKGGVKGGGLVLQECRTQGKKKSAIDSRRTKATVKKGRELVHS